MGITMFIEPEEFQESLLEDMDDSSKIDVVTAYMTDSFIDLLKKCKTLDFEKSSFIINTADRVTSKSSLKYLFNKTKKNGVSQNMFVSQGKLMHSKIIVIYDKKLPVIIYIGSSNLTAGGFGNNFETNIRISREATGEFDRLFDEALYAVSSLKLETKHIFKINTTWLNAYEESPRDQVEDPTAKPDPPPLPLSFHDVTKAFRSDAFLHPKVPGNIGQFTLRKEFDYDRDLVREFMRRGNALYEIRIYGKGNDTDVCDDCFNSKEYNISFKWEDQIISAGKPIGRFFARKYLYVRPDNGAEAYGKYIEKVQAKISVLGRIMMKDDKLLIIELKVLDNCKTLRLPKG